MGTTINGVYTGGKSLRRKKASERLEKQLITGVKTRFNVTEVLTSGDIARIKHEINILKSKI
jgi:hypothetical protein